jgi:hypothetical protein
MNIEIRHRFRGTVLWSGEVRSLGEAIKRASLDGASLDGASLRDDARGGPR